MRLFLGNSWKIGLLFSPHLVTLKRERDVVRKETTLFSVLNVRRSVFWEESRAKLQNIVEIVWEQYYKTTFCCSQGANFMAVFSCVVWVTRQICAEKNCLVQFWRSCSFTLVVGYCDCCSGLKHCKDRKFPISLQKCNHPLQVAADLQCSVNQPYIGDSNRAWKSWHNLTLSHCRVWQKLVLQYCSQGAGRRNFVAHRFQVVFVWYDCCREEKILAHRLRLTSTTYVNCTHLPTHPPTQSLQQLQHRRISSCSGGLKVIYTCTLIRCLCPKMTSKFAADFNETIQCDWQRSMFALQWQVIRGAKFYSRKKSWNCIKQ